MSDTTETAAESPTDLVLVQYIGPSHIREITTNDFRSIGAHGVRGIHVVKSEDPVVELPRAVAQWLVENDKDFGADPKEGLIAQTWQIISDEDAVMARASVSVPRVQGLPEPEVIQETPQSDAVLSPGESGPALSPADTSTTGRSGRPRSTGGSV